MRPVALLLPLLAACATAPVAAERLGEVGQGFTSAEAVLLDFAFDGRLVAATKSAAEVASLIEAQLMYTVGHLNADRSVGRFERMEVSGVKTTPTGLGTYDVTYHVKLPVAWGGTTKRTLYALSLPTRVGRRDQVAFAAKYGSTCVDPEAGDVGVGQMFIAYRPYAEHCVLDEADVQKFIATVTVAAENTTGKYPEYDRIWDDGALNVVAMFSQELSGELPESDGGVHAYDRFVVNAKEYLRALQPDDTKRTPSADLTRAPGLTMRQVKLGAKLPDGRKVNIDVMLVRPRLDDDGVAFDRWYDPLTPEADLILYNGHAGLGDNVRTLMTKGAFRAGKYVVWMVNSCDSFAYVDRTLIDRRAALNPDDPSGTKYMDTISNVMAGYFDTTPHTSLSFVEAIVLAGDSRPTTRTYQQIFASIDPEQIVVVTGEEDNTFDPSAVPPVAVLGGEPDASRSLVAPAFPDASPPAAGATAHRDGCSASGMRDPGSPLVPSLAAAALAAAVGARRRQRDGRSDRGSPSSRVDRILRSPRVAAIVTKTRR